MAVLLLNPGTVIFKDPMTRDAVAIRWWAERGLIHWEVQEGPEAGNYGTNTIRQTLQRLKGLSDMMKNSRGGNGMAQSGQIADAYQTYIGEMITLCEDAQRQGDPTNAQVTRDKAKEIKAKRQSRHMIMPGLGF